MEQVMRIVSVLGVLALAALGLVHSLGSNSSVAVLFSGLAALLALVYAFASVASARGRRDTRLRDRASLAFCGAFLAGELIVDARGESLGGLLVLIAACIAGGVFAIGAIFVIA